MPEGRAKVHVFVVLLAGDSEALIWSSTIAVKFFSEKQMFFLKLFIYLFIFFEISAYKEREKMLLVLRCLVHYLSAQRLITLVSPFFIHVDGV